VHFADFTDGARTNVFDGRAPIIGGMSLIAHLRGDFGFFGAACKPASLFDRPGQRLLHVHVLAKIHGRQGDRGVHVIRGRDQDGVDVLLALKHL